MVIGTIITIGLIALGIYLLIRHIKLSNMRVLDLRGYERDGYDRLVHRDVAYNEIYKEGYQTGKFTRRFGEYDVHHIDRNKRNNSPENLQILTREEHNEEHRRNGY